MSYFHQLFPFLLSFHLPTIIYHNIIFSQSLYLLLFLAFLIPPLTINLNFQFHSIHSFPTHTKLPLSQIIIIIIIIFWWIFYYFSYISTLS